MILERLEIGGAGRLSSGLGLDFSPGLNLVEAPNESGKSTLVRLLAALFYGFGRRKNGGHPLTPWEGGETGGRLVYSLAGGKRFRLARHLLPRGEALTLRDEADREVDLGSGEPGEAHLGVGRGVFLTVCSLTLDDLTRAFGGEGGRDRREARGALKGYFFQEAATRGRTANPVEVLEAWRAERRRLYSPDGRLGGEDRALAEAIGEARRELAAALAREEEAAACREKLSRLKVWEEARRRELNEARRREEAARDLVAQSRSLARRGEMRAELSRLADLPQAAPEEEWRVRDLLRRAAEAEERSREMAGEAAGARERSRELAASPEVGMEPGGGLARLAGLERDFRDWEARTTRQGEAGEELERRARDLAGRWGRSPEDLAALSPEFPFELGEAEGELARAREELARVGNALDVWSPRPPARAWAGWLAGVLGSAGLALAGLVLNGYGGQGVGPLPDWLRAGHLWATAGGLCLGGLGLGFLSVYDRLQRREWFQALAGLEAAEEKAEAGEAGARERLDRLLASLGEAGAGTRPAELSAALAEARVWVEERLAWERSGLDLEDIRLDLIRGLSDLGEAPEEAETAAALGAALARAGERSALAVSLDERAARLEEKARRESGRAEELGREAARALGDLGLDGPDGLDPAGERFAARRRLEAALAELEKGLGLETGREPEAPDEAAALSMLEQARAETARLESDLARLTRAGGQAAGRLESLENGPSSALAGAGLQGLLERREELARRYDTLLLAESLLERAMEDFRLEAQPGLLQAAAAYLEASTTGAYRWLGTDIFDTRGGGEPALSVRTGGGAAEREAGYLSRGAREQLYLSLRLALADEMTAGGEPLPLILDDPLVNFDGRRLEASLKLLHRVAGRRQVLFLTCHREQAEILEKAGPVRRLKIIPQ